MDLYEIHTCSQHTEIDYILYSLLLISHYSHQYEDHISLGTFLIRKTRRSNFTSDTKAAYDPRILPCKHKRKVCVYMYLYILYIS